MSFALGLLMVRSPLADGPEQQKLVAEGKAPLSFLDYDWTLNDARNSV